MSETTGIFDNHRDITKISAMPDRRFDTDFHGDADDEQMHQSRNRATLYLAAYLQTPTC
jgi:hypothetical protein